MGKVQRVVAALKATKRVRYTDEMLYTGRKLTVKYEGRELDGEVSNGGQCSSSQFAFSGKDGTETCIAKRNIVRLNGR